MVERTLAVRVSADISAFQQAMSQAQSSLHSFQQAAAAAGQSVAHSFQASSSGAAAAAHQIGSMQQQAASQVNQANSQIASSNTNSANSFGQFARRAVAVVGVGAAFKSTIKTGMDFQSSLNTLGAVSGATAGKMTQVADTARQLGNDISIPGASAADAAAAMTELAKGGLSVDQAMQAAKGTLQLAAAAQIDGAQAAEIQAKAINTFGLAGKDASHVGDVLANTANAATGDITDFAAALAQGGLVAHSMGISIDDTSTALGIFANQGLIGSDAGTSLKSMLVALQSPTKQQAAALEALGVKAYDAQGNFVGMRTVTEQLSDAQKTMTQEQFNAAAGTAFGTDAVRAAIAVAAGGPAAYDQMAASVSKAGGAATLAGAQMQGLKGAFGRVQNAVQDAQLALMDKLSPALEAGTKQLAGMIPSITDALVPALGTAGTAVLGVAQQALPLLSDAATAIAPLFTAAASGIGAIMPMLSGVVGAIGGAAKIFAGLPGPVHAAVLAMLAMRLVRGPLGSVGSAAGTVGTQIKLMGQQFATLRLAGMGSAVSAAAVGLRGMGTAARGLGRSLSGAFGGPIGLAIIAITTALSIFSNRNKEARDRIEAHKAAITELAQTMDKASGKISQATKDAVTQDFANVAPAFDAIGLKAGDAAQAIIQMQEDGGAAAQKFREQIVDKINFDDVTKRLSNAGVDFVSQFSGLLNMSAQDIMRIVAKGGKGADDLQAKLVALGAAPQFVTAGFNRLRGDTENVVSTFSAFISQQDGMNAGMRLSADAVKTLRERLASAAGVDFAKLNGALDSAAVGGKDLESVFAAFGFSGPQVAAILQKMGENAFKGADGLHYMTQAQADAGAAAAGAAPKVEALSGSAKKADDAAKKAAASADVWKKAVDEAKAPTSGLKAALDETKAAADGVTTAADFMAAAILRASGHDVDAATAQREQAAAMRGVTEGIYEKIRAGEDEKKSTADRIQAEKDLSAARSAGRAADETAAAFADRLAGLTEKVASAKRSEQDAHLKNAAAQTADVQGYEKAAATAAQATSQVTNVALATGDYTAAVAAGQGEMAKQRTAFIDSAVAAGVSKDAAAKLADQYGLMPKSVVTAFTAETAAAQRNGDLLIRTYDATNKTWTATFTSAGDARSRAAAGETLQAYDQVKGTWTANIDAKNQGALEGIAATTKAFAGMPDKTVGIGADTTNLYADMSAANKAKLDAKLSKFLADTNPYFASLSAADKAKLLTKVGPMLGDTAPFFGKLNEANKSKLLSHVAPLLADVNPFFAGLVKSNRAVLLSKVAPLTSDASPYFRGLSAANKAALKEKLAKLVGDAAPFFATLSDAQKAKFLDKLAKINGDNTDAKTKIKATQDAIDALTGKTIPITYTGTTGPSRAGGGITGSFRMARGGRLSGPGTGTSDSIPIDASHGEFITNARATAKHLPLLEAINRDVPAFAAGGLVSNVNLLGSSLHGPNFPKMFDTAAAKMMPAMAEKFKAMVPPMPAVTSGVAQWIPMMKRVIAAKGFSMSVLPVMTKQMEMESSGNPRAINLTDINAQRGDPSKGLLQFIGCVPLDTAILTRRGWLRHDEVRVGDETLGLNPDTGRSEWTLVTGVVHYEDAEVWRIGGSRWSADVTPRHRWAVERHTDVRPETLTVCPECGFDGRFGPGSATPRGISTHRGRAHGVKGRARGGVTERLVRRRMATTEDLLAEGSSNDRIVVAAPADTTGIPGLSVEDCAVLGWLHGDGHVQPALNTWGEQTGWDGTIYQAKPPMVVKLRSLLAHVPHTEDVRPDRPRQTWPAHVFRLRRAYVTELMKRSEVTDTSIEEWVCRLSPDQRAGWLGAMIDAEGNIFDGYTRISQVDGPVQDAIRLAVYLEGWRPSFSAFNTEQRGFQPSGHVGMATPRLAVNMLAEPKVLERQPVWCVTTELGTWTMRQGRRVTLTGNSTFARYADPGFNTNIWDPESQMRAFLNYVPARYGNRGSFSYLTSIGNTAYARGGMLHGPGTGTSDSLNIRASKGEYLTNARATAKHLPLLEAINRDVPAYAAGGLVSTSALAGLSPRQPGARESLVIDGFAGLTTAIQGLRDAAIAASEQYRAAAGALGDAQGEAIKTAAQGRSDVAAARKDLQVTQVDQGRNVAKAKLDAARSIVDAQLKRHDTLQQIREELATTSNRAKTLRDYAAADRATMIDLQRAQQDAALSTQDAILQQRREVAAAADKLRAVQAAASADNQSAAAKVAAAGRVRQAELQLAKASDARAARAEALQRAESRLAGTQTRLGQRFDLLTDQLGTARDKLSGLRDERSSKAAGLAGNIGNYDSGILGQPDTRRTPADIIRGLTFDLAKVSRFTNNLNELKKKGLSGGLLDQIASSGVDGGGSTAGTLRNASVADIARINALQRKTEQWANVGGSLVAGATFDPLIASQGALVNKLATYTAQVDGAMRAIAGALNAMDVKLVIDPQGIARLVNRGNVLLGRR